ncbi:MAG TPA: uroporphyrinogen decarboxylase [Candidatus Binataceae bacterium]|nr:uroporphyrinogen decarboxylase [Candidatus Binataceae bacterium]
MALRCGGAMDYNEAHERHDAQERAMSSAKTNRVSDEVVESGFKGLRAIAFESRMAAETRALIERYGGRATVAPSMREVPLEDNQAALDWAARVIKGEFDCVIFLTGVGTRELFRVVESRHAREEVVAALKRITTVARGPKPVAAMRELGFVPTIVVPEPNTWRELLAEVVRIVGPEGKRIAIQEYGVTNRDLIAGLEARGASVTVVPVYRWTLPVDRGPLREAIKQIAAGEADVVLFTSATQVTNVVQVAEAEGIGAALRAGFKRAAVGSIGPVCSQELRNRGIEVDLEPSHPKLGHLVKEAAARSAAILEGKRPRPIEAVKKAMEAARVETGGREYLPLVKEQSLREHPLMKACRREAAPYTPIWLMRQAGRYMPEYRQVRDQLSFLEMCQRPAVAAEVTVTAVERLKVDAAIIFADILLPLVPMCVGLHYEKGDGPMIDRPLRTTADLDRIPPIDVKDSLGYVGEAIRIVRSSLGDRKPVIGFAGAPFTLASYLIEGGASRQYQATKTLMYTNPDVWDRMMALIAAVTADYLKMQIEAGADVVQLFDSWVGSLGPDDYRRFVLPYTRSVIEAIGKAVPVIHFGTVTGNLLELMCEAGGDVIGLDWRVDLAEAWARLGYDIGVQGNLDPIALFAEPVEIRRRAKAILDAAGGRPGHIFNLGHGILPETPVDHVIALVEAVHELSARH